MQCICQIILAGEILLDYLISILVSFYASKLVFVDSYPPSIVPFNGKNSWHKWNEDKNNINHLPQRLKKKLFLSTPLCGISVHCCIDSIIRTYLPTLNCQHRISLGHQQQHHHHQQQQHQLHQHHFTLSFYLTSQEGLHHWCSFCFIWGGDGFFL
jgi:hypothetical protein